MVAETDGGVFEVGDVTFTAEVIVRVVYAYWNLIELQKHLKDDLFADGYQ